MARSTPIALSMLAFVTSACASYVDKPYQRIYVTTPGAENAECVLRAGKSKEIAHPPQEITIRNNSEPLAVTCHAPENRVRTVRYQAAKVESAKYNIATGYAPGMYYDYVEGSLYKYPERAVVNFKGVEARPNPLPQYQYATTPAPKEAGIENFGPGRSLLSWDEVSRSSSAASSSDGKNGESDSLEAPVPLPGKKDSGGSYGSEQDQAARQESTNAPDKEDTQANTPRESTSDPAEQSQSDSEGKEARTKQLRFRKESRTQSFSASETDQASAASAPVSFEARARREARNANEKQPQSGNSETGNSEITGAIDKPTRLYSGD